ncbi:MAG: gliding motility-associated C-terminal domain-containing protein [Mariniphaga sp.]|nr:gliding motility-associated C-terminal domain-containing protein [Mariniphaga sp.]
MLQKQFLFFVFSIFLIPFVLHSQVPGTAIRIDNSGADTVFYCNGPVAVASEISIENLNISNASDGIKISIANYRRGEDSLFYNETGVAVKWDNTYGNLELKGIAGAEIYEQAIRQVYYQNLSNNPNTNPRSFSITLLDADYLPYTGHFYRYIRKRGIPWTEARDSAANMDYYGLQGYLATITSSIENDFIWTKIDGVGWIGASDASVEGVWRWVTGPEAGTHFWQGTYQNGYAVNGRYSFWNSGEPNNVNKDWGDDEDYAHINAAPGSVPKSWNDLPNEGDRDAPNGYYYPEGFVVEFGGMPGDPDVQLSAAAVVAWSQKPEMQMLDFDSLVCGNLQQQLNLEFDQSVTTLLHPLNGNTSVKDETTLSPVVNVSDFGRYSFEVSYTNPHNCTWKDTVTMKFQHQPTARFQIDDAECEGYNLKLNFEGETVGDVRFDWYSNDTLYHSGINVDALEIPLGYGILHRSVKLVVDENGCVDSLRLPVTVTPVLDFWAENPEDCTPLDVQFNYNASEAIDSFHWDFGEGNTSSEERPSHVFQNPGTEDKNFDISLRIVSVEGCENSGTIKNLVTVHPIPSLDLDFSAENCYSEAEEISYVGSAGSNDTFLWDLTDFENDEVIAIPGNTSGPLGIQLLNRPTAEVGIQVVSEFGCKTDTLLRTFKRKPVFSIPLDTIGGCPPLEAAMQLYTTDSADAVNYFWDLGNGKTGNGFSVSQVYTEPGQNIDVALVAVSSLTQCSDTLIIPGKVFVYPVPVALFTANPPDVLISNPVIQFENQSQGATLFDWDFDNGNYSTAEQPEHQFENMGLYNVRLSAANGFGCADTIFSDVSVAFDRVFPPTAFSPNAAKMEDKEFRIYSEGIVNDGYKLLIFNRWGEVIFESQSQERGWDGTMKSSQFAPSGAYSWVIQFYDFLGKKHNQQGTVTLIF